jgi:hypothetical protein
MIIAKAYRFFSFYFYFYFFNELAGIAFVK